MKKISDLTDMDVIHCPTEREANAILKLADEADYRWSAGNSLLSKNYWDGFKKETCYRITGKSFSYGELNYYKREGCRINKASEFLELEKRFKVGDKVVPISKSIGEEFTSPYTVWNQRPTEQNYLFVVKTDEESSYGHVDYVLNTCEYSKNGDYYMEQDLIPYEEFVLPSKWKIQRNSKNYNVVNAYYNTLENSSYTSNTGWCYSHKITKEDYGHNYSDSNGKSCNHPDFKDQDYQEISFEQFKTHVLKQNDMREIIGYKLKDEFIYLRAAVVNMSDALIYPAKGYTLTNHPKSIDNFTKAGVLDLWFEPVYKQDEYKIGDWVYWSGNNPTFAKINSEIGWDYCYKLDVDGDISSYNSCHKSNLRKATTEEIKNHLVSLAKEKGFTYGVKFKAVRNTIKGDLFGKCSETSNTYLASDGKASNAQDFCYNPATDTLTTYGFGVFVVYEKGKWATITPQEKVVSVGGKFDVVIKDGKIWHSGSNITGFVKELVDTFNVGNEFGGYRAEVEDVIFNYTGCQYTQTRLSDWKVVLAEYNKING